jgi:hypothetical protein
MSSLHVGVIAFDWYPFHPRVRCLAEAAVDAGYRVDVICRRQLDKKQKRYEVHNGVHKQMGANLWKTYRGGDQDDPTVLMRNAYIEGKDKERVLGMMVGMLIH